MKKTIVTIIALVILSVTATFANGTDVSKDAQTAFAGSFSKATDVKWETASNYYKASFKLNDLYLTALVSEDGSMIAVSRNIVLKDLPLNLQASLNTNFAASWITNLVEYAVGEETLYFITVENANEVSTLQSVGTYDWSLIEKTAK